MIRSFSIVVPVYNKENAIIPTLESIEASLQFFQQQYQGEAIAAEVVIVNEGSSDRTVERVEAFCQDKPHYRLIHHHTSLGAGPARNTGVKLATGDLLFFCDGDDLFLPHHVYLCFAALTAYETQTKTLTLTVNDQPVTVELPQQPIGLIRTGVHTQDRLHPYWKTAVENSIPINVCVRRECHEFVEGYPEGLVYKWIGGCEDTAYLSAIGKFFRHAKLNLPTVEYLRFPGNNFDRQLRKFQTPPEQYQNDLTIQQREWFAMREKLEQAKLQYLFEKLSKFHLTPEFLKLLNWEGLLSEYLTRQDYATVIALGEAGLAVEPTALATVKTTLAVAYNNAGSAAHQQRNPTQAAEWFQRAIDLHPDLPTPELAKLHFNAAAALRDRTELEAARQHLQHALNLDANLVPARQTLSLVEYQLQLRCRGYAFTHDRLTQQLPILDQTLKSLNDQPHLHFLETGSGEGQVSCWLLDRVLTHASAQLTCIDGFSDPIHQRFDANIARTAAPQQVTKLVGKPTIHLRTLNLDAYHVVYLAGTTIACDALEEILLAWGLVKVGGLLILAQAAQKSTVVQPAIDAFLSIFQPTLKVLYSGSLVVVEKHLSQGTSVQNQDLSKSHNMN